MCGGVPPEKSREENRLDLAALAGMREEHARMQARADMLNAEVAASRARLAEVRALERRRLVREVTVTTRRELNAVRDQLWRLRGLLAEGLPERAAVLALADVRRELDDVLDAFRATVRGVFPAMLPEHGPQAALAELAATLPLHVRFDGDLGRRVDWHIESGLYHAAAAVLHLLARRASGNEVTVVLGRDGALQVRVTAPGVPTDELRPLLDHDASRVGVLGGGLACTGGATASIVEIWLPERAEIVDLDTVPPRYDDELYLQVVELVRRGRKTSGFAGVRQRWDAVAARLARLPRLAVVRDAAQRGPSGAALGRTSGVTLVDVRCARADGALAEEFLADGGPRGAIDTVLCLVPASAEFRAALRSGRHCVMLSESADLDEVVAKVVSLAPVIAARRAIVALRDLVSGLPPQHDIRRELDRIVAGGHEIAGLELLTEFEREDVKVFAHAEIAAAASRLLGARGTSLRNRIGLPEDASVGDTHAAAVSAVRWWRARASMPAIGGRERVACEVLARTAEGLLSQDSSSQETASGPPVASTSQRTS